MQLLASMVTTAIAATIQVVFLSYEYEKERKRRQQQQQRRQQR